ncbi:hypothetical protein EDB84DRAFT_1438589 [Lactarius hengduanensis]|nr:hypothetical protein EDB84DRAFT_1438589 [Lactarius hengduanensis]
MWRVGVARSWRAVLVGVAVSRPVAGSCVPCRGGVMWVGRAVGATCGGSAVAGSWCAVLGRGGGESAGGVGWRGRARRVGMAWGSVGWALRAVLRRRGRSAGCYASCWDSMTGRWWWGVAYLVGARGGGLAVEVLRAMLGRRGGFGGGRVLRAMSGRHVGAGTSGGDERA